MENKGGSARTELYLALRFFGLIDSEKAPTPVLNDLTAKPTAEKLRELVAGSYAPVIALNLETATPRQIDEALTDLGATPSTTGRARTFFLNAAEEAGLEVGHHLKSARGTTTARARSTTRSPRRTKKAVKQEPPTTTGLPKVIAALIDGLPQESEGWTEEAARRWIDLFIPAIAYGYELDPKNLTEVP